MCDVVLVYQLLSVYQKRFPIFFVFASQLDLSYNSLNNIPENMVDWSAVPSVDLQGNPWDCSCRLQWLLEVIVPKLYVHQPELLYELR